MPLVEKGRGGSDMKRPEGFETKGKPVLLMKFKKEK
jgi:hypothetical protein